MIHLALFTVFLHAALAARSDPCDLGESPWTDAVRLWTVPYHQWGPDPYAAVASDSRLYIVAENTRVPARLVNGGGGRILGISVPLAGNGRAELLLSPAGNRDVRYPRIAVDDAGALHVVWQEVVPRRGGTGAAGQAMIIKTASYQDGRWSKPQQLASFERTHWSDGTPSDLVRTASGSLHMALSAARENELRTSIHVTRIGGRWSVSNFPFADPFSYGGLAVRGDSLFLGAVMATANFPGETGAVWFTLSPDDGAHWTVPVLVSRSYQLSARHIRAVALRSGPVALVWDRQGTPTDFFSRVVWGSQSRDQGRTWDQPVRVSPSPRLSVRGASERADRSIDVLLWSNGVAASARFCVNEWSGSHAIAPSRRSTGSAALYRDAVGRSYVVWSAMTRARDGTPQRVWLRSTLR